MNEPSRFQPESSDEKLLAAAAHAAIILPFGFLVPLLIWVTQRKKTTYTTFQSLQALAYQLLFMLFYWLVTILGVGFIAAMVALGAALTATLSQNAMPWVIVGGEALGFLFIFGMSALYVLGGLVGGILCLTGKNFHYPIWGPRLEKYLLRTPAAAVEVADV